MVKAWCVVAVAGALAAGGGCDSQRSVTAPSPAPAPPPAVVERPLPPLSGAVTTYAFREALENFGMLRVSLVTRGSSFVLYESGGFTLQSEAFPHVARGSYEREDDRVRFYFSGPAEVDAIGTSRGTLMEVRYSEPMQHADFEDAVYQVVE
jgi:hypothetical protein